MKILFCCFSFFLIPFLSHQVMAQAYYNGEGKVTNAESGAPVPRAVVRFMNLSREIKADSMGRFQIELPEAGSFSIRVHARGFQPKLVTATTADTNLVIALLPEGQLQEVVVSGSMRPVNRLSSPIPVESYSSRFFQRNTSPDLFTSLGMINGVLPQVTCNVCNTGSLQINGLEGPYTMVLIDGMPIVSSLSTVYGFSGIPNSMIKRVEVVKGPASTLYGSEALAGVINIITKDPGTKNSMGMEQTVSSYGELNTDLSAMLSLGKTRTLIGLNHFAMNQRKDVNKDQFTDVTLQNRISFFNKWSFHRKSGLPASLAGRYYYEDRWGGQLNWQKKYRGSDLVYGESIYTNRFELLGTYGFRLGTQEVHADVSFTAHRQNSYYGNTLYDAKQHTAFAQLRWEKQWRKHRVLTGMPFRYQLYDDNSPATRSVTGENQPSFMHYAGFFVQDEWQLNPKLVLLTGLRLELSGVQQPVLSPRISIKYEAAENQVLRLTAGNGFRLVNLFTEDHAALTGARTVVIKNELKPERSWNVNLNHTSHYHLGEGLATVDANLFYTRFSNRILPDYDTDPELIIYDNLNGYSISKGLSVTTDWSLPSGVYVNAGFTWQEVFTVNEAKERSRQVYAPGFTANYGIGFQLVKWRLRTDFSGRTIGPMRLPVFPNDFRPEYSPWFSLLDLQLVKQTGKRCEWILGVKNLLNFLPDDPIMRPFDPFDRQINDPVNNPKGYSFDPSYNYAPMMARRLVVGFRYRLQER